MLKRRILALLLCLVMVTSLAMPAGATAAVTKERLSETEEEMVLPGDVALDGTLEDTDDPSEPSGSEDPSEPSGSEDPSEPSGSEDPSEPEKETEPFCCHTYDSQGNLLKGYWDEQDQVWYLFLPSTQSIGDLVLHYTGSVAELTAGQADEEAKTITGAFAESGDSLMLTAEDGTTSTVVVMQSSLPSVHVVLNDTTLEKIHEDKDKKHKGNSVYISDPAGVHELEVEGSVEIKGRGNSTWACYEKKAYQIKFDEKTDIMGMGKAKKWVLLANSSDDSMIRTWLVYNMASQLDMAFVPKMKYVDLWIDGEYRGTFLLGDKIELGSTRLDLENDTGALFEHDETYYAAEDYWFYSTMLQRHFVMKEIVEEEDAFIEAAMSDFEQAVDELAMFLYTTPAKNITLEDLSAKIDVDSFAKYYLINEYVCNLEALVSSFYWYKDGPDDVIHLGPIWDFDTCMGNDGTSYKGIDKDEHILFSYLISIPAFYERTLELLEEYRDELKNMAVDADAIQEEIAESAAMNYLRWDVLGKPNPKGGEDFYPTFDEAVASVKNWLVNRADHFVVEKTESVSSTVSDDCYTMDILFSGEGEGVRFAVWSMENGRDDEHWYNASENENGEWTYAVDLSKHNSAGVYRIDVYAEGQKGPIASGRSYVETAREPLHQTSVVVADDCETMTITTLDADDCSLITYAVWSVEGGQDDLWWYKAAQGEEGVWTYTVDMKRHQTAGMYHIRVYSGTGDSRKLVDVATAEVAFAVEGPSMETTPMYRLYNPNSGEHFYTGSTEERDILVAAGWQYEGVSWNAPIQGGIPVHRVYNPNSGDHHYTMEQSEVDMLVGVGWQYEGICWNSAPEEDVSLYRLWNPNADCGSHHYTSSTEERDQLVELGWVLEGIGWYGMLK